MAGRFGNKWHASPHACLAGVAAKAKGGDHQRVLGQFTIKHLEAIMRIKETLRILGGSVLVYVAVATCAGGGTGTARRDGGSLDTFSPSGPDVSGISPGGSDVSRVLDSLTDPVPSARADGNQSGTRLKARYYVGSDGSKEFIGWHDSQRNEDCGFVTASDGTMRCLGGSGVASVGTYFSDTGCTQPLVLAQTGTGCAVPSIASKATLTSCSTVYYTLFQVGSSFTGTPYSGTPSSCTKVTTTLPGYAVYNLGPEVPASSFVAATVQTDP